MRQRIVEAVPKAERDREIKRGPGGLRDIEFAVQLLQWVHGRADDSLHSPSTLDTLTALSHGGYVGLADGESLARAYRFLRTVEHRLQLQKLRRTHLVPADAAGQRWLAHALGYRAGGGRDAVELFRADWLAVSTEVRRLHAKLLYRPLLEAVARVPGDDLRLTPDAARRRLEALGFADPAGALRHLQALTGGVSRTAALQRQLLPAMLSEFADVSDATLAAALVVTNRAGLCFAIIGMGRLGGYELSYSSDADVLFVFDGADSAAAGAHEIAEELRRLLAAPAPDPPLGVDADLRPEGRQGPLVRSFAAYRQYYARWSQIWESQALLRARYVAGDPELGARFGELADRIRFPAGGPTREQILDIRRIKARVDSERLPRGADPALHAKLGRGGLADVEWTVQLLQLRYGHDLPALRTTRTLAALEAARRAELVDGADALSLSRAWTLASRVRNALMLVRG